jgi:CHAT domain-containing protein
LLGAAGCRRSQAFDAEKTYRDSQLRLERGDLNGAAAVSDSGLRSFPSTEAQWHWRFAVVLGEVLVRQGLNRRALEVLAPDLPKNLETSELAVRRGIWRAAADGFLGQFAEADTLLSKSESVARKYQPQLLGEVELRKGTLALLRTDTTAAESAYRSSLRIAREQNDRFLETAALGNLGLTATKQEHYDESIDWNREALRLSQALGAQASAASILGNMGWSYFQMGDYENALALFERAKQSSERAGATRAQIEWEINIGNVRYEERDFELAEAAYEEALGHARSLDYEPAIAECLENLADSNFEGGRLDRAQYYHDQVTGFLQAHRDHSLELDSSLIAGRIEESRGNYLRAEQLFQEALQDPEASAALRWEAEARLGETYAAAGRQKEAEREFRRSLETIQKARAAVKSEEFRLSFLSSATAFYNDYIDFLVSQNRFADALQIAAQGRAQTLAEGLATAPLTRLSIKDLHRQPIAGGMSSTYLFYWLGQKQSCLWAITTRETRFFILPPAAQIDAAVNSYREALLGPREPLETQNASGTELYQWLVAPAANLIRHGSRVVVVPDGSLYGLNFETLLVSSPQLHYWINDVVVVVANSLAASSAASSRPTKRPQELLLIGNPLSPDKSFPDLPQAASEMKGIEKHFQPAQQTVFSGNQATAQTYLESRPHRFSLIHFVAHGTASFASPLDSAVILTRQGDAYKLYARDIIKEPLTADLVTISACNGEGIRTYFAEGLVGLTWAFLRAGASSVIGALWEVNDNSTPLLMDKLYAEISKGTAAEVALRDAKLSLLSSDSIYRRPFYWAPFQIYESLRSPEKISEKQN